VPHFPRNLDCKNVLEIESVSWKFKRFGLSGSVVPSVKLLNLALPLAVCSQMLNTITKELQAVEDKRDEDEDD
jgi:uncharacterized protein involved in cysteine biosynthesis